MGTFGKCSKAVLQARLTVFMSVRMNWWAPVGRRLTLNAKTSIARTAIKVQHKPFFANRVPASGLGRFRVRI